MVILVSEDQGVYAIVRETLADMNRSDLLLADAIPDRDVHETDVCILDWPAVLHTAQSITADGKGRHLYLVSRDQIEAVSAHLPPATIGLLLTPLNRASLKLALEQALSVDGVDGRRGVPGDRDNLLQCLLEAYLRLQEYDQDRTNFLARAVHDFRAPLTAVSGYCGLLLEGLLGPLTPDQKKVLERMKLSTVRLTRMVTSMFDLTTRCRIQRPLDRKPASIAECVDQAVYEVRRIVDERDISINVDLADSSQLLHLDSNQIEQVLVNLLDNASRFVPKGGVIDVKGYPFFWERRGQPVRPMNVERRRASSVEPNSYRVDVRDNGPAIPPDFLPLLFEEYTSNNDPENRSGSGLGLAICKSIIHLHDGRIWANPASNGAVLSFVIPHGQSVDGNGAGAVDWNPRSLV